MVGAVVATLQLVAATGRADGPFIGQFELKTLESAPGYLELQSQNAYALGQPRRRVAPGPTGELIFDDNSVTRLRAALEAEVGFHRRIKGRIGLELEDERIDEPTGPGDADDFAGLSLTEIGAEVIGVLVPRAGDGLGVGVVVEYELPVLEEQEESSKLIVGPVLEAAVGRWSGATIPMFVHAFGGEAEQGAPPDARWDFAYALQLAYAVRAPLDLALEAYGTVHRIGDSGQRSEAGLRFGDFDQHRVGPIGYYSFELGDGGDDDDDDDEGTELTIGLGVLLGLNGDTPDATLKLSVELEP